MWGGKGQAGPFRDGRAERRSQWCPHVGRGPGVSGSVAPGPPLCRVWAEPEQTLCSDGEGAPGGSACPWPGSPVATPAGRRPCSRSPRPAAPGSGLSLPEEAPQPQLAMARDARTAPWTFLGSGSAWSPPPRVPQDCQRFSAADPGPPLGPEILTVPRLWEPDRELPNSHGEALTPTPSECGCAGDRASRG